MKTVIIMGAAGRDFHNFNVFFRDNENFRVVAFTATQIPDIEDRRYPPALSGNLYPEGIPIFPEERLEINRTGSIASRQGPAVTKTFLFLRAFFFRGIS